MATPAQIRANRANALLSTGPKTAEGKKASSKNRTKHGLCYQSGDFYFTPAEVQEEFHALHVRLQIEHRPETETERILVRRMADSEWLRVRATRLQANCIFDYQHVISTEQFALYMRYQINHERALYKALEELRKLRAERRKEEIASESQKLQQQQRDFDEWLRPSSPEPQNPDKNYNNRAPWIKKSPPNPEIP